MTPTTPRNPMTLRMNYGNNTEALIQFSLKSRFGFSSQNPSWTAYSWVICQIKQLAKEKKSFFIGVTTSGGRTIDNSM